MVSTYIPATVEVRVTIGEGGKAQDVTYDTQIRAFKLLLDGYFKEKTRYLGSCGGKTISFAVHYVAAGAPRRFFGFRGSIGYS